MSSKKLLGDEASEDDPEESDPGAAQELEEGSSKPAFWLNVQKARRCAAFVTLGSLFVLVPSWYQAIDPAYSANIAGGTLLFLVFTAYGNLGLTNQLMWEGFIGTFFACLVVHVLNALMPSGARGEHYNAPLTHAVNFLAIFLGYFLNIQKNTRMFYVCYHVYFLIEFVNPNSVMVWNSSWAINFDSYQATTLFTAIIGLVVAPCVFLIPSRITAKDSCQKAALHTTAMLTKLVDDLQSYYERATPSVVIFQCEASSAALRTNVGNMSADLGGAWWECFDMGTGGQTRELLTRHLSMMDRMQDNIYALFMCISKEDFGASHIECMIRIKDASRQVIATTKDLLMKATHAANDGAIDDDEKEELEGLITNCKDAVSNLAKAFNTTRMEISADEVISASLQSESFFVYCLSRYSRLAQEYTDHMLNNPPRPTNICTSMTNDFKGMFDSSVIIANENYRSFTLRNTLAVSSAFYIGMFLLGFDAVPAGTICVLISNYTGSALQKNLGRLQSVVVGTIMPHLVSNLLGLSCYGPRIALQALVIFAWEHLCIYIYFSSPAFGGLACLTAAFSLSNIIYPCVPHAKQSVMDAQAAAFETAMMTKIVDTTLGILIMTAVDMCLAPKRANEEALESFSLGLLSIDCGMQAVFAPRKKGKDGMGKPIKGTVNVQRRRKDIPLVNPRVKIEVGYKGPAQLGGFLSLAADLGEEAAKEPRYWRAAWPTDFFICLLRQLTLLRANLKATEEVFLMKDSESGKPDTYDDPFASIRGCPSFDTIRDDMITTVQDCIGLIMGKVTQSGFEVCGVLRNETSLPLKKELLDSMTELEGIEKLDAMPALMAEINELSKNEGPASEALKYPPQEKLNEAKDVTMEDDLLCRLNVVLMLMESSTEAMAEVVKLCIKNA